MARTLYLDCFSGISGDMALGALLDLGYSKKLLKNHLASVLPVPITFKSQKVVRQGLAGTRLLPILPKEKTTHRSLSSIIKIIKQSKLKPSIKNHAISAFRHLGSVEAKIHHTNLEKVHFHECGALDTIFDIVGFCAALDDMNIDQVLVSPINMGHGLIKCSHGQLPVPAPATLALLKKFTIYSHGPKAELTTPTGAALIKQFAKPVNCLPEGQLQGIGYGAGTKQFKNLANLLRVVLLDSTNHVSTTSTTDKIVLLKTNIDDQSPEVISYIQQLLLEQNVLDVTVLPIQMKKNRLATQLEVMCNWEQIESIAAIILKETSSLGVRIEEVNRKVLKREIKAINYKQHSIRIKYAYLGNQLVSIKPEFEDVKKLANASSLSFNDLIKDIKNVALSKMTNKD